LRHGRWGQFDIFAKGRRFLSHPWMNLAEILYTSSPTDSTGDFLESGSNSKQWERNFETEQAV